MSAQAAAALGVVLAYAGLCGAVFRSHARRRRADVAPAAGATGGPPVLIAYATQTGTAEQHARQTAQVLKMAGVPTRVVALSTLEAADLLQAERALFIVSTYGEGDAPDTAAGFARKLMGDKIALGGLHYGLLALGDRDYANFCGFGRSLDAWLRRQGALPLFDRIDMDNHSEAALREWQHHLSRIAGTSDLPDWQAPAFESWRLVERRLLNPGSAGAPSFHVEFEPLNGTRLPAWAVGRSRPAAGSWRHGAAARVLHRIDSRRWTTASAGAAGAARRRHARGRFRLAHARGRDRPACRAARARARELPPR